MSGQEQISKDAPWTISPSTRRVKMDRWYTYKGVKVRFVNVLGSPQPAANIHTAKNLDEASALLDELKTFMRTVKIEPSRRSEP